MSSHCKQCDQTQVWGTHPAFSGPNVRVHMGAPQPMAPSCHPKHIPFRSHPAPLGWTSQSAYPRLQQSLQMCSQLPGQEFQSPQSAGTEAKVGMCSWPPQSSFSIKRTAAIRGSDWTLQSGNLGQGPRLQI